MLTLEKIKTFDQLESYVAENSAESIYKIAQDDFDIDYEYSQHIKQTIKELGVNRTKLYLTKLLRKIKPIAKLYYKIKNVPTNKLLDKRPFWAEFCLKLLPAPFSKGSFERPNNFDAITEIKANIEKYKWLNEKLEDESSKNVLFKIMMFRITQKLEYIKEIVDHTEQYFDEKIIKCNNEVFIDIGGYDGNSTRQFIKIFGNNYNKIIIYEPEEKNFLKCKELESHYNNVVTKPYGVSDKCQVLYFESGKASGSKVSNEGNVSINVTTLDADIDDKITFIKADVEGHEAQVISGSANHIRNDSPKMAICVYHYLSDIWELPMQILTINANYKLYLRHYSSRCAETVLYAIPI